MTIVMTKKMLHMFWKNLNIANNNYKRKFDAYIIVLEEYTGRITVPLALVDGKLREL